MSDEAVISIVSIAVVFGAPMLWFIGDTFIKNWRKVKISEHNVLLKREMIEKGYTAEEIVRVIGAGVDEEESEKKLAKK